MARIRNRNLRHEECDTFEEVQTILNDVYRVLREQQAEIEALAVQPKPAAAPEEKKSASRKKEN